MALADTLYPSEPVTTPKTARWLFTDPRASWIWFAVRLYVGWQWFEAGREKIWPATGASWVSSGAGLQGYWTHAVSVPAKGSPPITYGWYREFIQFMLDHDWAPWFSKLIAIGEFAVGIALILGAFVAIAAFFGTVMNFSYMLAGSASTNPVMFGLAVFLVIAWKTAGIIGLDRWLLPIVRTPWQWLDARRNHSDEATPRTGAHIDKQRKSAVH